MSRWMDADETVIYRLKKSKGPIAFFLVFLPIWLFFAGLFLTPYWQHLFSASEMDAEGFFLGLAALVLFIPVAMMLLLSYSMNSLIITDRRVYIRRGLTGRTRRIDLADIRSFQHAYSSVRRGRSNHSIVFYLYCGRVAKTGELYITRESLEALLALLRGKFEGRGFRNRELKELCEQNPGAGRPEGQTNLAVVFFLLAPFILALLAAADYMIR